MILRQHEDKPLAQMVSSEANVMFKTQFDGNGSILAEIQAFEKTWIFRVSALVYVFY